MMRTFFFLFFCSLCTHISFLQGEVRLGIEVFTDQGADLQLLKGKKIGLITNQTAINHRFQTTLEVLSNRPVKYHIGALFVPEHGLNGDAYACESIHDEKLGSMPVYSLHGQTKRPTAQMLSNVDVLLYDIQDIGSRSYTYVSTLFYCMEEAAKYKIKVIVLDRPNPLGGEVVDGPLLNEKWRSFLGYINVPYCHGMTIGELAKFFNEEYKIGCDLVVIPMKGWKRRMTFHDTGLSWIPTSPQIPEEDTPFFYPTTGLIGHCSFTSIGIGYTLPFKVIGAPWIQADNLAERLNAQKLPGVFFKPFHYKPFFGKFKGENCQGVQIIITQPNRYLPVTTQYTIMGIIKTLYPQKFQEALTHMLTSSSRKEEFNKLNGTDEILKIISEEKFFIWKLREKFQNDREIFLEKRRKYLIPDYS